MAAPSDTAITLLNPIQTILDASPDTVRAHINALPPALVPWDYINTLENGKKVDALRLCLLAWEASLHTEVPRENQLHAALSMSSRKGDVLVIAGTGSGKTLIMVLLLLMQREPSICITISPLKRLQITQAKTFNEKYHINTICVNDDTPRASVFWKENVFDFATRTLGTARHLIVTTEQSFITPAGHLPRLGQYLRNPIFRRHVTYFFVDEVHTAHYAGIPRYGLPAFRKTWGQLDEIKSLFPSTVPWMGLTATCPPHVQKTIEDLGIMRPGYEVIRTSVNRPNTMYATYEVKSLDDANNYRCFIRSFDPISQPRVLIFCDNKEQTVHLAKGLAKLLPEEHREKGIIRHYHGGMSKTYCTQTHEAFTNPEGSCRILFTTSGEATGVDFRDVTFVCGNGLPSDISYGGQCGGRAVRLLGHVGIYVIFYESWAADGDEIKLEDFDNEFGTDPDRPRSALTEYSSKRERAGFAPIRLIQCAVVGLCIRKFLRDYFDDITPTALDFNGPFCCDRHNGGFNLEDFLPGSLAHPTEAAQMLVLPTPPVVRNKYRSTASQAALIPLLTEWRRNEYLNDPLRAVSPEFDILSDKEIKLVARWKPNSIALSSSAQISLHLAQTREWRDVWGRKLFLLLFNFDLDNPAPQPKSKRKRTNTLMASENASPVKRPRLIKAAATLSRPLPRLLIRIPPLHNTTNFNLMTLD